MFLPRRSAIFCAGNAKKITPFEQIREQRQNQVSSREKFMVPIEWFVLPEMSLERSIQGVPHLWRSNYSKMETSRFILSLKPLECLIYSCPLSPFPCSIRCQSFFPRCVQLQNLKIITRHSFKNATSKHRYVYMDGKWESERNFCKLRLQ